jgi:hypothetical protein
MALAANSAGSRTTSRRKGSKDHLEMVERALRQPYKGVWPPTQP